MGELQATFNVKDHNAETIDGSKKLREKTLYEVLQGLSKDMYYTDGKFYDIRGTGLFSSGETVSENYAIIEGIQKLFEDLADEHKIQYNDTIRATAIHGFEIYSGGIGDLIKKSFKDQRDNIRNRDRRILGSDSCNINLDECNNKHSSFGLDKTISGALASHSRKGCTPKYKLVTICICYSLKTYPDLPGWQKIIKSNIEKFEDAQRDRMRGG